MLGFEKLSMCCLNITLSLIGCNERYMVHGAEMGGGGGEGGGGPGVMIEQTTLWGQMHS